MSSCENNSNKNNTSPTKQPLGNILQQHEGAGMNDCIARRTNTSVPNCTGPSFYASSPTGPRGDITQSRRDRKRRPAADSLCGVVDEFASGDRHHRRSSPRYDRAPQLQRAVVPESPTRDSHDGTSCIVTVSRAVDLLNKNENKGRTGAEAT